MQKLAKQKGSNTKGTNNWPFQVHPMALRDCRWTGRSAQSAGLTWWAS